MLGNAGNTMTKLLRMARDFVFIKLDYILLRKTNAKLHVRSRECVNYIARCEQWAPVIDKLIKQRIFINIKVN